MKVKDAMHRGAEWIGPETPLVEVAKLMKKHDIGCVPVGDKDRLVGMVTDRDIVCRAVAKGGDLSKLTARDVMSSDIVWCREGEDLDAAIRLMEQKQIRRLPVISEAKRLVGMLTLGDVSHASSRQLAGEVAHAVSGHHH